MSFGFRSVTFAVLALATAFGVGHAQQISSPRISNDGEAAGVAGAAAPTVDSLATNRFQMHSKSLPFEYGAILQGGIGLTEERSDFKFLMAGVHAGKVLYSHDEPGLLHGNFEYAMELFPYWQSFTPKFQRYSGCFLPDPSQPKAIACTGRYATGGTYGGVTLTPIILRWNFASHGRITPWAQAAGGVLWTNHKYPAFGSPVISIAADGPNTDASVWNFTPQGGVGFHYFLSPLRSIDFGANAVHISSASLGDRNPGVNASVQFSVGYTFWK